MKRSDFLKNIALLSAGTALLPKIGIFRDSPFTELRRGAGIFSMRGGTIGWLVTNDSIVVIDSQYADTAPEFLNGIDRFGGGPEKVLFNTHHHGDHTAGNKVFDENGYQIIAHEQVPFLQQRAAEAQDTEEEQSYAETTFVDSYDLDLGTETIMAKYYGRAHTSGDSVIWLKEANIAHMGDLVFNRMYPFIDRDNGASIKGWIELLESVAEEAESDTQFIFGHGNPEYGVTGDRDDLLYMRDFLTAVLDYTQKGLNEGKSREEIMETTSLEQFPNFISPLDFLSLPRNLDVAYHELTEENG
ncbi:MBL fold metallo-hydrolase [soil metagenome]